MSVQLWSSSGRATEGQAPLSSAEALLCDMDGTLVDSLAVVESMWASFARDHGMSERFDEIMAYSPGRTGLDTIRRFLPELTADEQDAIYKRFAREEIVRTAGRMAEIPGAAALVTALIEVGVPLALVTSASRTSPPTSAEPGILRAALQNFCWGTREMPSSRLGTERRDSGTRRFPQPSFDTASPQSI